MKSNQDYRQGAIYNLGHVRTQTEVSILVKSTVNSMVYVLAAAYDLREREWGVVDPHHFHADPGPSFHFHTDPDLTFHFNADLDLVPHQSDANTRPLVYRPSTAPYNAPRLQIGPPCLHCERRRPFMAPF